MNKSLDVEKYRAYQRACALVDELGMTVISKIHYNALKQSEANGARLAMVQAAFDDLMAYRRDNVLSFQLEKLDDYLRDIASALKEGDL